MPHAARLETARREWSTALSTHTRVCQREERHHEECDERVQHALEALNRRFTVRPRAGVSNPSTTPAMAASTPASSKQNHRVMPGST